MLHPPRGGRLDPGRPIRRRSGRPRGRVGLAAAGCLAVLVSGCAATPGGPRPAAPAGPLFAVGRDTFAFANLVRAERPGLNDAFANYCLIMARAAGQFYRFARFDPRAPVVPAEEYTRLTRAVLAREAWTPPLPPAERVVIPGYSDLFAFSRAQPAAIKAAFGSNVLSMMHPRTWRVAVVLGPQHQAGVARALRDEVEAGRPAPVMVTNYPEPDVLNHAVLVYGYRETRTPGGVVAFEAYDPNDPGSPFELYFDPGSQSFWVGPLPYSPPGRIRAFRLYTSPFF
jgi:hypothetical protein